MFVSKCNKPATTYFLSHRRRIYDYIKFKIIVRWNTYYLYHTLLFHRVLKKSVYWGTELNFICIIPLFQKVKDIKSAMTKSFENIVSDWIHSKNRLLTVKRFSSLSKDFIFKIGMRGNPLTVEGLSFQINTNTIITIRLRFQLKFALCGS